MENFCRIIFVFGRNFLTNIICIRIRSSKNYSLTSAAHATSLHCDIILNYNQQTQNKIFDTTPVASALIGPKLGLGLATERLRDQLAFSTKLVDNRGGYVLIREDLPKKECLLSGIA